MARYEDAVRLDASLAVAKNNLAYLLADTGGDLDRALDLAQQAKEQLPDNANAADTLGWVLYKRNVPSAAIGYLREAERGLDPQDPHRGAGQQQLALASQATGEPDHAREVIDRALAGREPGGEAEPTWAVEMRAMRDSLDSEAAAEG